jgi:hypothetical protein
MYSPEKTKTCYAGGPAGRFCFGAHYSLCIQKIITETALFCCNMDKGKCPELFIKSLKYDIINIHYSAKNGGEK